LVHSAVPVRASVQRIAEKSDYRLTEAEAAVLDAATGDATTAAGAAGGAIGGAIGSHQAEDQGQGRRSNRRGDLEERVAPP
jgi:hypothetical protein